MRKSKKRHPPEPADSEAVLVMSNRNAVNATAALFQVCAKSSTGADAVIVPLLAVSVLNVPVVPVIAAGVVEPIGVFWIEANVTLFAVPTPRSARVIAGL